jgi:putative effector of murein hydrolase
LPEIIAMSLAPKSATTGAAMAISKSIGGVPAMTATFTVTTSIIAAVTLVSFIRLLRVKDLAAIGFSVGLSGHSVGIALCLNAILTELIMPVLLAVLP